jgi:hypothetical protein
MGRGENFYVYQGFDRTVSFTFKIAIGSHEELNASYTKLNTLISQIYPDYNKFSNFMTSPVIRLTIGDYLYRVHGFLESVNVTVDQNSSWEITDGEQLPHVVDVAITFKPILSELPRRGDPNDAANVPNIIRQTDANEYKGEVYIPKDTTQTSTTTTTPTTPAIPPLIKAPSGVPNLLDPNAPGSIFSLGFGTNTSPSPGTKTAVANIKQQGAVAKKTKKNKESKVNGQTTAPPPAKNVIPFATTTTFPNAQVGSIGQFIKPKF